MIKPVLFNTEMVKSILEGRKIETRRIVKNVPVSTCGTYSFETIEVDPDITTTKRNLDYETLIGTYALFEHSDYEEFSTYIKSAYNVGDILWVRETWKILNFLEKLSMQFEYAADGKISEIIDISSSRVEGLLKFFKKSGWIPSLFMPREAARIFLKVTSVRVERLRDITDAGAKNEGTAYPQGLDNWVSAFIRLWNSTIKKTDIDINGWDADPWVWVYEFERCEKPAVDVSPI